MNRKIIVSLIILLTILTTTLLLTCTQKPTEPLNDNPFDPKNTTTCGDPFRLTAQIANGGITLTWNKPAVAGLANFKIYRSEQESSGYSALQQVGAATTQYVDQTVQNGHSYWYRVTALNSSGRETAMTNTAAVNIKTDPVLVINGGAQYTPTRQVNLTILANTAQQMMLSNSADFSGAQWEPYATSKSWTLPTGEGEKTVYLKVKYDNGQESAVVSAGILPQPMNPAIVINNNDNFTVTRDVTLQLTATAAIEMIIGNDSTFSSKSVVNRGRTISTPAKQPKGIKHSKSLKKHPFKAKLENVDIRKNKKNSPALNTSGAKNDWEPFSETKSWTLKTGAGTKTVYAKFRNDFEIESELVFDTIEPKMVTNYSFTINGGTDTTNSLNVVLNIQAEDATHMMIANDASFTGAFWEPYAETKNWTLSPGGKNQNKNMGNEKVPGMTIKMNPFSIRSYSTSVFMKFKNDFEVETPVVSNDILVEILSWIKINNDSLYTASRQVTLNLFSENADEMMIGNDSLFTASTWEPYDQSKSWILPAGDGPYYVYVKFRNKKGKVEIDWKRTKAWIDGYNCWVNLKGRTPDGCVAKKDYEKLRDELIRFLYSLNDPITGECPVSVAVRREDAKMFGLAGENVGDIVFHKSNIDFNLSVVEISDEVSCSWIIDEKIITEEFELEELIK